MAWLNLVSPKKGCTNWSYVKEMMSFIDKVASEMTDCCKTKQGLMCLLTTGSLKGVPVLPLTTGQTEKLEKKNKKHPTVCFLIVNHC